MGFREVLTFPVVIVLIATAIGAVTDVWKFRVYNALTFPLLVGGMLYHTIAGGTDGLVSSSFGVLFGFGILLLPYALGLMGAGDVKLLAGIGAWLGFGMTCLVFTVSSLAAGVYAMVLIIYRGKFRDSLMNIKVIFYRFAAIGLHLGKQDLVEPLSEGVERRLRVIPFAAMVLLGVVGALAWLNWIN